MSRTVETNMADLIDRLSGELGADLVQVGAECGDDYGHDEASPSRR